MSQIFITKGQATTFTISVVRGGAAVNLGGLGVALRFLAKRSSGDSDENAVLSLAIGSGITVTDADLGHAEIVVDGTSTAHLGPLDLLLFYRLTLEDGHGIEILDSGSLRIDVDAEQHLYVSVADVRAEGFTDPPYTDAQILSAIWTWQTFLERACRQWFYPRELELWFDGTNSDTLHFGVPIISVTEVRINGDTRALEAHYYRTYGGDAYADNYHNPRLKLIAADNNEIFSRARGGGTSFRMGHQNQYIRGMFGYVEEDGGPPPLIKRALLKLVAEKITRPIYPGEANVTPPPLIAGLLREEWTDGHRIKVEASGGTLKVRAPGLAGITDDPEILGIIRLYRAPMGLATSSNQ